MNDILIDFQEYIKNCKKNVSLNTFIAYNADVTEFFIFLSQRNKLIKDIKSKDFFDFFNILEKRKLSISSGARKSVSLRIFAKYLHEKHNVTDYTEYVQFAFSPLPIICKSKQAFKVIQEYKKRGLISYNELRNFVILYLLYISRISINRLIQLKISDVKYITSVIVLSEKKFIKLAYSFNKIINEYIGKIPHKSDYLFPVLAGEYIKPISKQSVWTILRSIFKKEKNNQAVNLNNCKTDVPMKILEAYKIKHPRA